MAVGGDEANETYDVAVHNLQPYHNFGYNGAIDGKSISRTTDICLQSGLIKLKKRWQYYWFIVYEVKYISIRKHSIFSPPPDLPVISPMRPQLSSTRSTLHPPTLHYYNTCNTPSFSGNLYHHFLGHLLIIAPVCQWSHRSAPPVSVPQLS